MRYRPLGATGRTVSAITLAVEDEPRGEKARVARIYAALESGVNSFELRSADPQVARALGIAFRALERDMVSVALRLPYDGFGGRDVVLKAVEQVLLAGRLQRLDLLILDQWSSLDMEALGAIAAAKAAGRLHAAVLSGEAFERLRNRPEIDGLACGYNLRAGWPERNRIRAAVDRGKFVWGWDSYPDLVATASVTRASRVKGLFGLSRRGQPIEKTGGYEFMRRAAGWSPDEICLAYALTEPALATVVVEADGDEEVERLAEVAERELPSGMPAQIEMARFAVHG